MKSRTFADNTFLRFGKLSYKNERGILRVCQKPSLRLFLTSFLPEVNLIPLFLLTKYQVIAMKKFSVFEHIKRANFWAIIHFFC